MRQEKIMLAYKQLEKLNKIPGLPFGVCSKLYMVKKSIAPFIEAQKEKEQVLFEAAGIDDNGNVQNTRELRAALADILKTEVDCDIQPIQIQITPDITEKVGMTGEIIEHLEGFVEFVEVGS